MADQKKTHQKHILEAQNEFAVQNSECDFQRFAPLTDSLQVLQILLMGSLQQIVS
jgi:hypothetical protein